MNRKLSLILLLASILLATPLLTVAANSPLYVKVRSAKLRNEPKQWAPSVSSLNYGDAVAMLSTEGAWLKVKAGSRSGYLHNSAVSERKVVLQAAKSVASTGNDKDVILAGKGFNKEVEKNYAAKNSALNYAEVDKMERLSVGDNEIAAFVKAGKLGGGK